MALSPRAPTLGCLVVGLQDNSTDAVRSERKVLMIIYAFGSLERFILSNLCALLATIPFTIVRAKMFLRLGDWNFVI